MKTIKFSITRLNNFSYKQIKIKNWNTNNFLVLNKNEIEFFSLTCSVASHLQMEEHDLEDHRYNNRLKYCICMAESLSCSPETITLLTGYTLIQN